MKVLYYPIGDGGQILLKIQLEDRGPIKMFRIKAKENVVQEALGVVTVPPFEPAARWFDDERRKGPADRRVDTTYNCDVVGRRESGRGRRSTD